MASQLLACITSDDPNIRNRSVLEWARTARPDELAAACDELESFRGRTSNLYERVRAAMLLHAIYRYCLQESDAFSDSGIIPYEHVTDLLERRFEQAIGGFRGFARAHRLNGSIASALAHAYGQSAFQTLADQVRTSVRQCAGNRWMFRVGSADEHPAHLQPALLERDPATGLFPILREQTPVRLDLSHSGWSDIFFLGMDYPEGARVLNISVDLGVNGRDATTSPPIETYVRVITEPLLRLTSIDLGDSKDITSLEELFNFGNDYLSLVKAGVIASGLVPPSLEGCGARLIDVLANVVRPGHGLEVVTKVNDIPKGSRLAVSTNLLASLISVLMRATGQARRLTGPLDADAAKVVVARAILGEWLGGSGGGWQDSGGVFPGVKVIRGVAATADSPEWGVSRGRLLPEHELLGGESAARFARALAGSLVLVHGGMAQNVGPILNMVTEKYLLRLEAEWKARQEALGIFDQIVDAVNQADVRRVAALTHQNWSGPLKKIIPAVSNAFTERLIRESQAALGDDFWGFLMLGGMSGGGMGCFVAPHRKPEFLPIVKDIMRRAKADLEDALPFAMEPVVYDFVINGNGTYAELMTGRDASMPSGYYTIQIPRMTALGTLIDDQRKLDLHHFGDIEENRDSLLRVVRAVTHTLFPLNRKPGGALDEWEAQVGEIKRANGFDPVQHDRLRSDYQRGRIGVARNRLPVETDIRDAHDDQILCPRDDDAARTRGESAIRDGEVAVLTLAGGVGSRWTSGAGVVKAVNPFLLYEGQHRSFLEIHFAKTRKTMESAGVVIPHVVTSSFLTDAATRRHLARTRNFGQGEGIPIFVSPGMPIYHRLIPMARDLIHLWEESPQEILDENKQKVREASRRAILDWVRLQGEGNDYTGNLPIQRFNPPGHFYSVPNLFQNGVLHQILQRFPNLRYLMMHNVDTLGADLDPEVLGAVIGARAVLSFEVVPRRIDDHGGGLAQVNGRTRLVEGLSMPREEAEFRLRYYNTLTTWIEIDGLLRVFGLSRDDIANRPDRVAAAVRETANRLPTYVTIKDVKRRWGHGQEDIFPVAQFEKLWGDMTALPDVSSAFLHVGRHRGQQLKDPAQVDGWLNDGGYEHVMRLCRFAENPGATAWAHHPPKNV